MYNNKYRISKFKKMEQKVLHWIKYCDRINTVKNEVLYFIPESSTTWQCTWFGTKGLQVQILSFRPFCELTLANQEFFILVKKFWSCSKNFVPYFIRIFFNFVVKNQISCSRTILNNYKYNISFLIEVYIWQKLNFCYNIH